MYEMKDEYLLGIPVIDEQHTKLFELTEQAYQLLKNDNMLYKCADIRKILGGIKEYSGKHFLVEEDYMRKSGYGGLAEHIELHKAFTIKVDEFDEHVSALSLGTQDDLLLELLDYLVVWLEKHIREEDKKYAERKQESI